MFIIHSILSSIGILCNFPVYHCAYLLVTSQITSESNLSLPIMNHPIHRGMECSTRMKSVFFLYIEGEVDNETVFEAVGGKVG